MLRANNHCWMQHRIVQDEQFTHNYGLDLGTVVIIVDRVYKEPYQDYKSYDHQLHNAPLMERIHFDPFFI